MIYYRISAGFRVFHYTIFSKIGVDKKKNIVYRRYRDGGKIIYDNNPIKIVKSRFYTNALLGVARIFGAKPLFPDDQRSVSLK